MKIFTKKPGKGDGPGHEDPCLFSSFKKRNDIILTEILAKIRK
jgi:hypothetical protein